jgi:hypothetical protein
MPVMKCSKGWKWGQSGKCYPTKKEALRQGRAIEASKAEQAKKNKRGR